jgi:hypothetical protein
VQESNGTIEINTGKNKGTKISISIPQTKTKKKLIQMPQSINALIVDDHPFIIQGYKNVINLYPNKEITLHVY